MDRRLRPLEFPMFRAPVLRTSLFAVAFAAFAPALALAQTAETRTFIMPEDDGYGVMDCLAAGPKSGCGRIVADAWCESKGFVKARTFGREDAVEVTGSVAAGPQTRVASAAAPRV